MPTSRFTTPDLQATAPAFAITLAGVGVTGVRRSITLADGQQTIAAIDATVDLGGDRTGAHMSRFHETISAAIDESLASGGCGIDQLAAHIAATVTERQQARSATVEIRGELELADTTPVSGLATREPVGIQGHAQVDAKTGVVRRALGVTAVGMNACPCAQGLVRERAMQRLLDAGFTSEQAELALEIVPVATHNQRGTGTLLLGSDSALDIERLAAIVRSAMSASIHELLKRPDELHVVEQAHANPRFVEDCVRAMLAGTLASDLPLAPGDLVWARQVNHESIHAHDVVAERGGLAGDLRNELATPGSTEPARVLTPQQWLAGTS